MSVLMIAPTHSNLPNVAREAAVVVNALGGKLLQGQVTEKDVQDAASEGGFDGIWFATHAGVTPEGDIRVLLSGESLSEAAVVAYVAASGASWCFLNTCQSNVLGLRIIDETPADVICTVSANPDPDAMRTGVLFARLLAQIGTPRAAYERAKPGGNRNFVYLENYNRQSEMTAISGSGIYPAQDANRLQTTMDEMRRDMSGMASDVAVLKTRTGNIESRQERIEARLKDIEYQLRPTPSWQTWAMLIFGLVASIGIVMLLLQAGG